MFTLPTLLRTFTKRPQALIQPLISRLTHPTFSTTTLKMAQEYKIKDLTSINLKDGQMQEAELEGLEGGKVLLLNSTGKIHATSSNCTHYGAPLKNGVLSSDGRLTCPWHGEFELQSCPGRVVSLVAVTDMEQGPASKSPPATSRTHQH